ncbi:hypothetical protein B0T18DRAFT_410294 [Schizothecium vesticola]|uniref:Uncharacterized protein n=1 Tax=Schizothecium vesticola TaxID=314040 RepID=A0AA40EUL8_9PEZI|nr:hypothetical protein B0T18DRAFT_410294 [Schizothecium vesticola]
MLQLGSGAAVASTMLRCSALFLLAAPFAGAKFAFYPLIPGFQLLRAIAQGGCAVSSISTLPSAPSAQRPAPTTQHVPGALGP